MKPLRERAYIPIAEQEKGFLHFLYQTKNGRRLLKVITHRSISKVAGGFLSTPLSIPLIRPFIRKNNIDMTDCKEQRFSTYNKFFTRELHSAARPIEQDPLALISPCDGKCTVYPIAEDTTFQVKGASYTVSDLLGGDPLADRYRGGYCMIFRLCVDDYHRYCYVANGEKDDNHFLPGILHTVQPIAVGAGEVYKRNCREYTTILTDCFGAVTCVEVGALMVGKIKNHHGAGEVVRGTEKGMFLFGGSTIVVLVEPDRVEIDDDLLANTAAHRETLVKYGERVAVARSTEEQTSDPAAL